MGDIDSMIQRLEAEFPRSLAALNTEAPAALTERVLSIARRNALALATGLPVAPPPPRRRPPLPPGKRPRERDPMFSRKLMRPAMRRPPRFAKEALRSHEMSARYLAGPTLPPLTGDEELARLRGRDRATWRQRMAELVLQGELDTVKRLLEYFEMTFGEPDDAG